MTYDHLEWRENLNHLSSSKKSMQLVYSAVEIHTGAMANPALPNDPALNYIMGCL